MESLFYEQEKLYFLDNVENFVKEKVYGVRFSDKNTTSYPAK